MSRLTIRTTLEATIEGIFRRHGEQEATRLLIKGMPMEGLRETDQTARLKNALGGANIKLVKKSGGGHDVIVSFDSEEDRVLFRLTYL